MQCSGSGAYGTKKSQIAFWGDQSRKCDPRQDHEVRGCTATGGNMFSTECPFNYPHNERDYAILANFM